MKPSRFIMGAAAAASVTLIAFLWMAREKDAGQLFPPQTPSPATETPAPSLTPENAATPSPASTATPIASTPAPAYAQPVADFKARITKKSYGTYVTPQNSPVSPEKFTGFHTGVDVEFDDVPGDVPVHAAAAGTVERSGTVSGYGGFIAIRHAGESGAFYTYYGHLKADTLPAAGSRVGAGDKIGILGKGNSTETDGERKHLHFAVSRGTTLSVRGYVASRADLEAGWRDPLSLYE